MGAQIAAHVANAGLPVLLFDLTADTARDGLKRARALKPDPVSSSASLDLIDTGGFDRDFDRLSRVDWIVEAIVEQVDAKRQLFGRIDTVRRAGSIVSSNTSGIRIAALADGLSDDFRR